ncbi:MAG: hypothetical protein GXY86_16745 [Firmicutes bacterium]|nr:hypothetical protein [Bacillota bacterium]
MREDVSVTTETYTNEEGASVTVTTTERGNVTEQTVTVTDKDGNSKTETLSYVNGIPVHIEDQRNVIARYFFAPVTKSSTAHFWFQKGNNCYEEGAYYDFFCSDIYKCNKLLRKL